MISAVGWFFEIVRSRILPGEKNTEKRLSNRLKFCIIVMLTLNRSVFCNQKFVAVPRRVIHFE